MDRSGMSTNSLSDEYKEGVKHFLEFVEQNSKNLDSIQCPCSHCGNFLKLSLQEVKGHLYINGIDQSYCVWIWHREHAPSAVSPNGNT